MTAIATTGERLPSVGSESRCAKLSPSDKPLTIPILLLEFKGDRVVEDDNALVFIRSIQKWAKTKKPLQKLPPCQLT